jgi:vacuolar-type H+-ATPase subunit I/STV1
MPYVALRKRKFYPMKNASWPSLNWEIERTQKNYDFTQDMQTLAQKYAEELQNKSVTGSNPEELKEIQDLLIQFQKTFGNKKLLPLDDLLALHSLMYLCFRNNFNMLDPSFENRHGRQYSYFDDMRQWTTLRNSRIDRQEKDELTRTQMEKNLD